MARNRKTRSLRGYSALTVLTVALLGLAPITAADAARTAYGDFLDLGGVGLEIEVDRANGLAYVTAEGQPTIFVVDVANRTIVREIPVAANPRGISFSHDMTKIYAALTGIGSVAEIDIAGGNTLRTFDMSAALDDLNTYDVAVVGTNTLFATASPGSSSSARLAKLDLTTEEATATSLGVRRDPAIHWDGADSLFVSEGFSPNSLYRLDLSDPDLPVVAEDVHNTVGGTRHTITALNGARAISPGTELDANTLAVLAEIPGGLPETITGGAVIFIADSLDSDTDRLRIRRYNLDTHSITKTRVTTCDMGWEPTEDFKAVSGTLFVATGQSGLCIVDFTADFPSCHGLTPTHIGTSGDDRMEGTSGNDVFLALGGWDEIHAGEGDDVICAGGGNDTIFPGTGDDFIDGGSGRDTLDYSEATGPVVVDLESSRATGSGTDTALSVENASGSLYNDVLRGDDGPNVLIGDQGDDRITGRRGDDTLQGDSGEDILSGQRGNDTLIGGSHDDVLDGGPGDDSLDGGYGADDWAVFDGAAGPVTVNLKTGQATGQGNDTLVDIANVVGSPYDDRIIGNGEKNYLFGGDGADVIAGKGRADRLDGWRGADRLLGNGGNDLLIGYEGNDELIGGPGADLIAGETGDDVIDGGKGRDSVTFEFAAAGVVVDLRAGTATGDGTDSLSRIQNVVGSNHDDTISGAGGRTILLGLDGNDNLAGRAGHDALDGGAGIDYLRGGSGDDVCIAGERHSSCETKVAGDVAFEKQPPGPRGGAGRIELSRDSWIEPAR